MKPRNRRGWYYYQPLQVKRPWLTRFRLWKAGWRHDLMNLVFPARQRRWLEQEHGITLDK